MLAPDWAPQCGEWAVCSGAGEATEEENSKGVDVAMDGTLEARIVPRRGQLGFMGDGIPQSPCPDLRLSHYFWKGVVLQQGFLGKSLHLNF